MKNSVIDYILYYEDGVHEIVNENEEYKKVSAEGYEIHNKLRETLSEKQKAEFDKFIDLQVDERCIKNEKYFKEGFKAGLRLAVECLTDC